MKKLNLFMLGALSLGLASCASTPKTDGVIALTDSVIVESYIGNGAQWDPYDEAIAWGQELEDRHWDKLTQRVDFMKMGFVRCLINSPYTYFDPETGTYDKNRNNKTILRLLDYCTKNNITVLFGEYNPPTSPGGERWDMYQSQEWVEMAVNYLNYLVVEKGMTCIKYYNFFNEPDGNWASTNGNYEIWYDMFMRFHKEMTTKYPELAKQVQLAGPDIVANYTNPASQYGPVEWVKETALRADSIVGLYDIHAYPGQVQIRSGELRPHYAEYRAVVPKDKPIVLGEGGYKYHHDVRDSILLKEYLRRATDHPFTKGSDCNMLVYDYFYGLDMPLLVMNVINVGYSGIAAWMMDDAMHSNWDSGEKTDIKLWGFWNTLGSDVFNDPSQEEIRPWFYSFSLMTRYFPAGCSTMEIKFPELHGLYAAANINGDAKTLSIVNFSDEDYTLSLEGFEMSGAKEYIYQENNMKVDSLGLPLPSVEGMEIAEGEVITIPAQSFKLITNNNY